MPRTPLDAIALLFALVLIASAALAYEVPLDSDSVREAYFLGQRNDDETKHFFDPYTKYFLVPPKGPHISEIQLLTPYAQVVDISRHKTVNYSAQDALDEYRSTGDTIVVYVRIEFTPSYTYLSALQSVGRAERKLGMSLQPEDFWRDFDYRLVQYTSADALDSDSTSVQPRDARATPIYVAGGQPLGTLNGTTVRLTYNANEIESQPTLVGVIVPDGPRTVAKFDLSQLR